MPEVRMGDTLKAHSDPALTTLNTLRSPSNPPPRPLQQPHTTSADQVPVRKVYSPPNRRLSLPRRLSPRGDLSTIHDAPYHRQSLSYALRPQAEAYYDSRAAGHTEYRRRAKNLREYYADKPDLLPQLPFSWHHGNRRWRLWLFAFIVFVDASLIPVALYFGMKYPGHVQEYIIFAVVTTIWGGPTYLEFGIRTLRLMKKERFYRPLDTTSRWVADSLTWSSSLTITVVTALFIIGSAPHDTWLRVVSMAAPSILWCYGSCCLLITIYYHYNWPFFMRLSSTAKGEKVLPGVYYFIEDVVAVNAKAGRPFREALAARYDASPRFRRMLAVMSWFWSIGSLVTAFVLTFIAVLPWIPENWGYGICWVAPFIFAFIWGCITISWCKKEMRRERLEWESGEVPGREKRISPVTSPAVAEPPPVATAV